MKEQILILFSTSLYIIVIGFEILLSHLYDKKYYTLKETFINIYLCVVNSSIDLLFRLVYVVVLWWFYRFHFMDLSLRPVLYWALLFIGEDFIFYIEHRVDHYCRLFWAVHVTHHSSEQFNLTTGFRSSVFQPLYRFIYFIPLVLAGFKPVDIIFMYSLTQIYGILVHTQYVKKMPAWFESVFVSPSHHRVHHASNIRYLDRNMGMVLIIWDKLFGSFQEELPSDPIRYGLVKQVQKPHHLTHVVLHEFDSVRKDLQRDLPFLIKIKYLLMPPGWSHDGSTKTASELRKEILQENANPVQQPSLVHG